MIRPAEHSRRAPRAAARQFPFVHSPSAPGRCSPPERLRLAVCACSLAFSAACSSATCPSGRLGGTGACITSNSSTADDTDGGNPPSPAPDDEDAGPEPPAADGGTNIRVRIDGS